MREEQEQPHEEEEPQAATLSAADAMSLISQPREADERASDSEEDGSAPS